MRKHRHRMGLLLAVLATTSCGSGVLGRTFRTERDLLAAHGEWVVVGRFDVVFPARVVAIQDGRDEVRFQRGSTPQVYSGFTGYDLRALQLEGDGRTGWLVLRGKEQRQDEPSAPGR